MEGQTGGTRVVGLTGGKRGEIRLLHDLDFLFVFIFALLLNSQLSCGATAWELKMNTATTILVQPRNPGPDIFLGSITLRLANLLPNADFSNF